MIIKNFEVGEYAIIKLSLSDICNINNSLYMAVADCGKAYSEEVKLLRLLNAKFGILFELVKDGINIDRILTEPKH